MTIVPLVFSIKRDRKSHKKKYVTLRDNKLLSKPLLPKGWQDSTTLPYISIHKGIAQINQTNKPQQTLTDLSILNKQSYAIRPDDDLVVIDCDSLVSTQNIDDILLPYNSCVYSLPEDNIDNIDNIDNNAREHYIVQSDKGERHFYFAPTTYYKNSPLYKQTRVSLPSIDILHGKSLVFAPNDYNKTKQIMQGSLLELTPIPDNIVDYLVSLFCTEMSSPDSTDYRPSTTYLAPIIEQQLALYHRDKAKLKSSALAYQQHLRDLFQILTPKIYKQDVEPDYHPDNIRDGEGTTYIQAVFSKVATDPSVSLQLAEELITLITQELWSDPLPQAQLDSFIEYMPKQVFSATKRPLFTYSPTALERPLVAINGGEFMPLYRTAEDDYVVPKPQGSAEIFRGFNNFKRAILSTNYQLLIDGSKVAIETPAGTKKLMNSLSTLRLRKAPYQNTGEFMEEGSLYYNTYIPTRFIGIIKGTYLADKVTKNNHPTILRVICNVMLDNLIASSEPLKTLCDTDNINMLEKLIELDNPQELPHYKKFMQFISHKLRTLDYSPLAFQLMGNRGVGKSLLLSILDHLTNAVMEVSFSKSNAQFNEEIEDSMFLNEDEGIVTHKLVNQIKKVSGKPKLLIEGKSKTPYLSRNIGTYISTTNETTPLAEVANDRRFVTFSSFKAQELFIPNLTQKIALELEDFALYLRDIKIEDLRLYTSATQWHDSIHYNNFEEEVTSKEHNHAKKLSAFVFKSSRLTGQEIHEQLEQILGKNYHYSMARNLVGIYIPLANHIPQVRQSDGEQITHSITREQCKKEGIDRFIDHDRNGTRNLYKANYYKLKLPMTSQQFNEWEDSYNNVTDTIDM